MKHTKNQTNDTTANQSPKMSNYLLVKIALAGIISSLLLILLINLIFHVRLGTPIIDTNLKSAFGTLILFMPIFLLTREKEKYRKSNLNCLQENKNTLLSLKSASPLDLHFCLHILPCFQFSQSFGFFFAFTTLTEKVLHNLSTLFLHDTSLYFYAMVETLIS